MPTHIGADIPKGKFNKEQQLQALDKGGRGWHVIGPPQLGRANRGHGVRSILLFSTVYTSHFPFITPE